MDNNRKFAERFREAFNGARNKDIANLLGVSKATITLYTSGRLPPPDMLLIIAEKTRCNLHWLLTGCGPKWAPPEGAEDKGGAKIIAFHGAGGGGTGKSTAAVFISMSLARRGHRTLLVEHCHESSPTFLLFPRLPGWMTLTDFTPRHGAEFYRGEGPRQIFHTPVGGLDIMVGSEVRRLELMENGVEHYSPPPSEIPQLYSFIVVEAKSSLFLDRPDLLKARLVMPAKVLISIDPNRYDTDEGLPLSELEQEQEESDEIEILGAFINMAEQKGRRTAMTLSDLRRRMPGKVLETVVHSDPAIRKVKMSKRGAFSLGSKTRIVQEYDRLTDEILLVGKNCKGW